jgi:hypothetical protein
MIEEETQAMSDDKNPEDEEPSPGEEIAAVFANQFYAVATKSFTRITFGESVIGDRTFYRNAIVLPTDDARELAELLLKLIRELDAEDAHASPA